MAEVCLGGRARGLAVGLPRAPRMRLHMIDRSNLPGYASKQMHRIHSVTTMLSGLLQSPHSDDHILRSTL